MEREIWDRYCLSGFKQSYHSVLCYKDQALDVSQNKYRMASTNTGKKIETFLQLITEFSMYWVLELGAGTFPFKRAFSRTRKQEVFSDLDQAPILESSGDQFDFRRAIIAQQAKSFAAEDGTVLWTLANFSWLEFVLNWVAMVRRAGIEHFFVATLDDEYVTPFLDFHYSFFILQFHIMVMHRWLCFQTSGNGLTRLILLCGWEMMMVLRLDNIVIQIEIISRVWPFL